jgi:hypothetical protein
VEGTINIKSINGDDGVAQKQSAIAKVRKVKGKLNPKRI